MTESALGRAVASRVLNIQEAGRGMPDDTIDSHRSLFTGSTPEPVRTAVMEDMGQHRCDHYTRRPGIAPLCRRVAEELTRVGMTVDPDEGVVISGGAQETRFVTLQTLGTGQTIYMPDRRPNPHATTAKASPPTFDEYTPIRLLTNLTVEWYTGAEPFASRPGLWIWHSSMSIALEEIHRDAIVIADALDAAQAVPDSLNTLTEAGFDESQVLVLGGFGRNSGLGSWNVASFAGPNSLVAKVRTLKQAMTICTPAPGQYAALATMEGTSA